VSTVTSAVETKSSEEIYQLPATEDGSSSTMLHSM